MEHYLNLTLNNLTDEIDGIKYTEQWLPIINYEESYHISNFGRLKTLSRIITCKNGKSFKVSGKIKKQHFGKRDYLYIGLCKNNKTKTTKVHRLVAIHFIPNPNNKPEVNHKKGIKIDNRAWMLEWSTTKDNLIHARENGLLRWASGEDAGQHLFTNEQALYIFNSKLKTNQLAEQFSVDRNAIFRIRNGACYSSITGKIHTKKENIPKEIIRQIFFSIKSYKELMSEFKLSYDVVYKIKKRTTYKKEINSFLMGELD